MYNAALSKILDDSGMRAILKQQQDMSKQINQILEPVLRQNRLLAEKLSFALPQIDGSILQSIKLAAASSVDDRAKIVEQAKSIVDNIVTDKTFVNDLNRFSRELKTISIEKEEFNFNELNLEIEYESIEIIWII